MVGLFYRLMVGWLDSWIVGWIGLYILYIQAVCGGGSLVVGACYSDG